MSWEPIEPRFDELIHSSTRLRIASALAAAVDLEFSALEEALAISTSLLSKQLKLLAEAGYVALVKRPRSFGRPRTWVSLTALGKRAYLQHVASLRQLINGFDEDQPLDTR